MMRWMAILFLSLLAGATGSPLWADGWRDVSSFSIFSEVDTEALTGGSITGSRASVPDFAGALGVQTLFVMPQPVDQAATVIRTWDPTRHGDGPSQHVAWTGSPSAEIFAPLKLNGGNDAWLVEQTKKAAEGGGLLNLNQQDATKITLGGETDAVTAFWRGLLLSRAGLYQRGGLSGLPACDLNGHSFQPASNVKKLFSRIPSVTSRFQSLTQAVLNGNPQSHYWEHSVVSRHGALVLGAIHGEETRLIDIQYYVTSDYWVSITFYELWPVEAKGQPATLVWRGDYVLTPAALGAQGIERMAAENLLLKEVKRAVGALQHN
jgi:hypothetical protein